MRERVTTDQIKLARTVDLISYMQQYEPEELIRTGPHDYKTATHSSLCISDNGLWHWYSRGIGGRGALNYLIQVTATILMVDTNVQREHILPSEKAKAYKMKLEAMKRKAGRPSKENSGQVGQNFREPFSVEKLAEDSNESVKQVQRYIRLNNLIPELMEMVDENKLKFNPAVEISYLTPREQEDFYQYIDGQACSPSLSQAQKLKAASREGNLTPDKLENIMTAQPPSVKPREAQISISMERVSKYFPKGFTQEQIVNQILRILEAQYRKKNRDMER